MDLRKGLLILDDTALDKPYARKMALVTHHWSGKHQQVVQGIDLLTLIPCDFRVYDKPQGGKTKNENFQDMLKKAKERGFAPEYVLILKLIASFGWFFLTRLKRNRLVNPDGVGNRLISKLEIPQ